MVMSSASKEEAPVAEGDKAAGVDGSEDDLPTASPKKAWFKSMSGIGDSDKIDKSKSEDSESTPKPWKMDNNLSDKPINVDSSDLYKWISESNV